jgi:drug/metabolite transporter superfamily protein YnfA
MQDLEPPIQNLDALDIVGERKDGGVDLIVSCSGPLDSSTATLSLIERKVRAYLVTSAQENFARIYPAAAFGAVRIFISCEHYVSGAARELIDTLGVTAAKQGVSLLLVSSMAQQSN